MKVVVVGTIDCNKVLMNNLSCNDNTKQITCNIN